MMNLSSERFRKCPQELKQADLISAVKLGYIHISMSYTYIPMQWRWFELIVQHPHGQ